MKCRKCGRELRDPESMAIGYGPVCRERYHIKMRPVHASAPGEIVLPGQMSIFDIIGEDDDGGREGTGDVDEGGAGGSGDRSGP